MRNKIGCFLLFLMILTLFASLQYAHATSPSYTNLTNSNSYEAFTGHQQDHGSTASASWTDANGLSGFIFSANNTGKWIDATWIPMTGTSNNSVFVYTANDTINNVDAFKFSANNSNNEWTTTSIFTSNGYYTNTTVCSANWQDYGHDWYDKEFYTKPQTITLWQNFWITHGLSGKFWSVGKTYLNNDIWMFTCGNLNGLRVLWDGELHGDEDRGENILWDMVNWLFNGSNEANTVLSKLYLMFIPVVNFDSYARFNYNSTSHPGVNLNRNFETNWAYGNNGTQEYSGPSAGSENETQVMRNVTNTYHPFFYMNVHDGGNPTFAKFFNPYDTNFGDNSSMNLQACNEFIEHSYEIADDMGINSTMYDMGSYSNTSSNNLVGYAINDAYHVSHVNCSFLIECECDISDHNVTSFNLIQSEYTPKFEVMLRAQAEIPRSPLFAMKTQSDGIFYWPNETCVTFRYIKLEEWFTNVSASADQCGLSRTGYPFQFPDGVVDGCDLALEAKYYGSYEGKTSGTGWNYTADCVIGDSARVIDGSDTSWVANHFGQGYEDLRWYSTNMTAIGVEFWKNGVGYGYSVDQFGFVNPEGYASPPYDEITVSHPLNSSAVGAMLSFWS